jgi:3-dehydroquinate dehydratase-2
MKNATPAKRIVVVNGPNLNLLGKREPHIYGTRTLADLDKEVRAKARELGVTVSVFQSNEEGAILDFLQKEAPGALGIVINPAALSHYSLALFDCLTAVNVPTVEVHLSNIHAREKFRSKSVTARAARGVITGLGFAGYGLAMEYLVQQGSSLQGRGSGPGASRTQLQKRGARK